MRISDWSSDVCSSDLHEVRRISARAERDQYHAAHQTRSPEDRLQHSGSLSGLQPWPDDTLQSHFGWSPSCCSGRRSHDHFRRGAPCADRGRGMSYRSEEHTSELQSLMRISYAVFCLKKKKPRLSICT